MVHSAELPPPLPQLTTPPVVLVTHRPHCRVVFCRSSCCRSVPVCQRLCLSLSKHLNCYSLQHLVRNRNACECGDPVQHLHWPLNQLLVGHPEVAVRPELLSDL